MQKFLVGGAVRDALMGVQSNDLDYAVGLSTEDILLGEDPFNAMDRILTTQGYKIFVRNPEFLTIRAMDPKGKVADFVLCRREGNYSDGRRPDLVEVGTLFDDLSRRDFTMNAMAQASDGSIIDYFGGQDDIRSRIIRSVGDPWLRFEEDALRIMRVLRFSVTKGFNIERPIWEVLEEDALLEALSRVADERVAMELSKMLRFDTGASLELLGRIPKVREVIFSGKVSLDATLKTKGRGK